MNSVLLLGFVLTATIAFGLWHKCSRGQVRSTRSVESALQTPAVTAEEIGASLGSRVTLLQFSTAFCSPCRATKALLADVVSGLPDVVHIDIDAESHLDLVRRLHINSTPTTLILDRNGIEVGRASGAPKRDQVIAALAAIS